MILWHESDLLAKPGLEKARDTFWKFWIVQNNLMVITSTNKVKGLFNLFVTNEKKTPVTLHSVLQFTLRVLQLYLRDNQGELFAGECKE